MSERSPCSRRASSVHIEIELPMSGEVPFPDQQADNSSTLFRSIAIPTYRLAE